MSAHAAKRIIRRETHSGRSLGAILVALLALGVAAWLGTETVLHLLGREALLLAPGTPVALLAEPSGTELPAWATAVAVGVLILGVIAILAALLPGRSRARSEALNAAAVVVEDRALAARLARSAELAAGVPAQQVSVQLSRSAARVLITPRSGVPVDPERVREAISAEPELARLSPRLRLTVAVNPSGKVGT